MFPEENDMPTDFQTEKHDTLVALNLINEILDELPKRKTAARQLLEDKKKALQAYLNNLKRK